MNIKRKLLFADSELISTDMENALYSEINHPQFD